jgi:hypothetical protein
MPYWIEVNDNLAGVCAFRVSVVDRCKLLLVHGLNAFMHWVVHLRGSSYLVIEVIVSGWGCCPLACRWSCLCRAGSRSPCCFTHVSPSFSCASAWSHSCLFPILRAWCSPSDELFSCNRCCRPVLKKLND